MSRHESGPASQRLCELDVALAGTQGGRTGNRRFGQPRDRSANVKIGGPSEFTRDRFEGIRIHAAGQNIITIGDGNQIEARFKDVGEALANLADTIIASEDRDDSAKLDLVADINSMQDQLAKKEPNKGALQSLWTGAETAAKAAGIVEAVTKVTNLLQSVLW